jgi:uncharacterized RDD family membrane protein YckC
VRIRVAPEGVRSTGDHETSLEAIMSTAPDPGPGIIGIELSALSTYGAQPGNIQGVTFWPRALARLIDLLVHFSVSFAAGIFFTIMLFIAAAGHPSRLAIARLSRFSITAFVMALLGSIAYQAICEGVHGSSLGKLVLSMVVVQEDGSPCRLGSAVIRSFAYVIDGLFFGLIGYAAMQNSPQEQRHGDEWAHTVVCKRSNAPPASLRGRGRFVAAFVLALMADAAIAMLSLLLKLNG